MQLERAAGAGIEYFQRAQGVNVPRSRFIPVKRYEPISLKGYITDLHAQHWRSARSAVESLHREGRPACNAP